MHVSEASKGDDEHLGESSPLVLGLVALPQVVAVLVESGVVGLLPEHATFVTDGLGQALFYPLLTGPAAVAAIYFAFPTARETVFRFSRPGWRTVAVVLGAVVGGIVLRAVGQSVLMALGVEVRAVGSGVGSEPTSLGLAVFVLAAVVVAPLVEEALFRGFLFGYLRDSGASLGVTSVVVVVAFALFHLPAGPSDVVTAGLWGLLPLWLRIRYDSLTAPWLLHMLSNALGVVLFVLATLAT